jgi:hypothetical protein
MLTCFDATKKVIFWLQKKLKKRHQLGAFSRWNVINNNDNKMITFRRILRRILYTLQIKTISNNECF